MIGASKLDVLLTVLTSPLLLSSPAEEITSCCVFFSGSARDLLTTAEDEGGESPRLDILFEQPKFLFKVDESQ
jgi:hypothetical protein